MPNVVTANNLRSGAVVYLGTAGTWVENLKDAAIALNVAELNNLEQQAQAAVAQSLVTAVYAMAVSLASSGPEPLSVRECIRAAHAPTV